MESQLSPTADSSLFADSPALFSIDEPEDANDSNLPPQESVEEVSQEGPVLFFQEEARTVYGDEGCSGYIVLARRYRPQTFDDIVGQEHVRETLRQAILSGQIAHAYLFSGPRGTGKTSTARILAKAVNCQTNGPRPDPCGHCASCRAITSGNSLDVIEIDAASNTGVDSIRELRTGIVLAPFSRYKVYIVDEVHMLSMQAFNALLKTLEEPPPRVIFVLATTELHKVPQTIISRCQCFQFRRFTSREIISHLDKILTREAVERGIHVDPQEKDRILELIALAAEGGMRDAQVALDQILVLCHDRLDYETVRQFFGGIQSSHLERFVRGILERRVGELLQLVNEIVAYGLDLERFVKNVAAYLRDLLLLRQAGRESNLVDAPEDCLAVMEELANAFSLSRLVNLCHTFVRLADATRTVGNVRFLLELEVVRLACLDPEDDLNKLIEALKDVDLSKVPSTPAVQVAADVIPTGPVPSAPERGIFEEPHLFVPANTPSAWPSSSQVSRVTQSREDILREACKDSPQPQQEPRLQPHSVKAESGVELLPQDGPLPVGIIEDLVAEIGGAHKTLGRFLPRVQSWEITKNHLVLRVNPVDRLLCDTLQREANRQIIAEKFKAKFGKQCTVSVQFVGAEDAERESAEVTTRAPFSQSMSTMSPGVAGGDDAVVHVQEVISNTAPGDFGADMPTSELAEEEDGVEVEQDNAADVCAGDVLLSVEELLRRIPKVLKGAELKKYLEMHPDAAAVVNELKRVLGTDEITISLRFKPAEE